MGSQFNTNSKRFAALAPTARFPVDAVSDATTLYEVDVLVIGASRRGSQAACAAAALGAQVLVLDKQDATHLGLPLAQDKRAQAGSPAALVGSRSVHWLARHHGLELLLDEQGQIRGAAGVSGSSELAWQAHAGAVVLAGEATFLMAAEAGADEDVLPAGLFQAQAGRDAAELGRAAAAFALQQGLPPTALSAKEAQQARLRATGHAGLRGSGRNPINPFALQQALRTVASSASSASSTRAPGTPGEQERLDALWQLLLMAAPAARGALSACRSVAERLALARHQAQRRQHVQHVHSARHAPTAANAGQLAHEFSHPAPRLRLRLQAFAR